MIGRGRWLAGRVPSVETLLAFTLIGAVQVIVPGPSVLFIIGRALAFGRRAALASAAGNTVGACGVVVVVAFGFGAVAARSVAVFTVLKLLGAAYLVYLGVQMIRRRGDLAARLGEPAGAPDARMFWQGVVVGGTNPKVLVFFAAVLPQFVDGGWALVAGGARDWFATSPTRLRLMGGIGGSTLIVMGAGLALSGRRATA